MTSVCLNTGEVNLDYCRISLHKVTIFPFVINKYLQGDLLRLQISCHSLNFSLILAFISGSCLQQLLQ